MLTEEEKTEIMDAIRHHESRRAACVDVLKIVQRHRGWVSDEIHDIAGLLDMTTEEVDGLATFYSFIFRRPVGKHMIMICDSVCCWTMGYEVMREHLTARLGIRPGETTGDGQFTLLPVSCLGLCDTAPAMIIGDEVFGNLTTEKIDAILERYAD